MRFLLAILFVTGAMPAFAIDLDGQIDFSQRLTLNSSVSARVHRINVAVGQQVEPGELLLLLDKDSLQADVDQASAEVDALTPSMQRMLTELEKAQELFDRDSLALVALQHAEQDYAIAVARLKAARAKLTRAQYRLSEAEIRSPIAGIVLGIAASPGQYINTRVSDQALLTLADNKTMVVTVLLPLEHWNENLLHRAASVTVQKQSYPGKIVALDQQVTRGENNHPSLTLMVSFEADGKLPARLGARVNIASE